MLLYLVFAALFVAPFVDVRRPLRLRHLDLVVLATFGLPTVNLLEHGARVDIRSAYLVATAGLVYLVGRASYVGFAGPRPPAGPLTRIPVSWLASATVAITAVRVGLPLVDDRNVVDVGSSSVLGAENLLAGVDVYGADGYRFPEWHPDTYGPVTYLLYAPFAWLFDSASHAARAATTTFDLATLAILFLLGRRLGGPARGTEAGVVLAFAWTAYPITLFATLYAYNDALVPMLMLAALLAATSPARTGVALGLGAAAKFVPVIVTPLYARGFGDGFRAGRALSCAAAFAVPVVAATALLLPDGGVGELLDRTIGWQLSRESPGSIWSQFDVLEPARYVVLAGAASLAVGVALMPRRRDLYRMAALSGAVVIAFELALRHWLPSYALWFVPFVVIAVLAAPSPSPDVPQRRRR